jgi:hypothetical protein
LKSFKTYIALGILALIVSQSLICFFLEWKVTAHHAERWSTFKANQVTVFLTEAEFGTASVNKHEIRLRNHLFDIQKLTKTADGYRLNVTADKDEDGLLNQIADFFSRETSSGNESSSTIASFYAFHFFEIHDLNMPQAVQYNNEILFKYLGTFPSPLRPVSSPPPDSIS